MAKLTATQLKKQLASKTKEQLIHEISTLYQKLPQVKEYYQAQGEDIQEIAKKHKDIIEKEFVEGKTRGNPKLRFSVARNALNDFKKLTDDPALIADVMLTYVESISWFNSEYGPDAEEFYTRPENMFEETLILLKQHDLLAQFESRAYKIVEKATDGYGHYDSLRETFEEVYGEFSK